MQHNQILIYTKHHNIYTQNALGWQFFGTKHNNTHDTEAYKYTHKNTKSHTLKFTNIQNI